MKLLNIQNFILHTQMPINILWSIPATIRICCDLCQCHTEKLGIKYSTPKTNAMMFKSPTNAWFWIFKRQGHHDEVSVIGGVLYMQGIDLIWKAAIIFYLKYFSTPHNLHCKPLMPIAISKSSSFHSTDQIWKEFLELHLQVKTGGLRPNKRCPWSYKKY